MIEISPASGKDVWAMARIVSNAFIGDANTELKYRNQPGQFEKEMAGALLHWLKSPRVAVLKATEDTTVKGWLAWGYRGMDAPKDVKEKNRQDLFEYTQPVAVHSDRIKKLLEASNKDMTNWMEKLMPEGANCRFVVTLSVDPQFQSSGTGQKLLQWGTQDADQAGVFTWVHSSMAATKFYQSAGFEPIGTTTFELDEYRDDDDSRVYGSYTFTYMKRMPLSIK
ncbi:hypothetical protein HK103_000484 [Boothiomyces macroporosus]|uniref:N-acetyltransferase domain-containing protein n=1 Tax=Boothiomyces macroporosus TaxID=261099 RepID=A0AAD5Y5V2_9FUNG|nr:hypothetical protein HK103_000484 [Boothiomyces macroporosus]